MDEKGIRAVGKLQKLSIALRDRGPVSLTLPVGGAVERPGRDALELERIEWGRAGLGLVSGHRDVHRRGPDSRTEL